MGAYRSTQNLPKEKLGEMSDSDTIASLFVRRVRETLEEMADRPPRDREALAGAVERLLRAKPLANEGSLNILEILQDLERRPKPINEHE